MSIIHIEATKERPYCLMSSYDTGHDKRNSAYNKSGWLYRKKKIAIILTNGKQPLQIRKNLKAVIQIIELNRKVYIGAENETILNRKQRPLFERMLDRMTIECNKLNDRYENRHSA